jgi:hypothetical protein
MDAFGALKKFFRPTDVTIALPTDPFIVIDRARAIVNLKLDQRAEQNGGRNFPPPDSDALDDVELDIVSEISDYATRAQIDAAGNHRIYGERLSELALLRELSAISGESEQALGDYRATVINREGRLALAKDAIKESYQELANFKQEHGLNRPAHRGLHPAYAWSAIGISWFVESAFNTAFLRVGDELGLIGGFVAAAVVAAVNVFLSALVGRFWWPFLFHRNAVQKRLAIAGCSAWGVGLLVWNLLAGHFRDAKAAGRESPESAALDLFLSGPLQFDSIYSYGLLLAGIAFAILSATAAYKMDDPYPGYGAIYRRHEDRCAEYADEIELAMEELKETRDDAIDAANATRDQLGVQFRERGQILAARETHRARYREHQDYLEMVGNALLGHYRAANTKARPDGQVPSHFSTKWSLKRTELPLDPDEPTIDDEVMRAQQALENSITTIASAYRDAIESFEHLDKIKRSLGNG